MKKYKITTLDTLKAYKKASRECVVSTKSNTFVDRKKSANKKECRKNCDLYL